MRTDLPPALRALFDVGNALLQRSSSGRLLLGRAAGIIAPGALPEPLERLEAVLARSRAEASEPLAPKAVERALRGAWGRAPGKVLDDLELESPVAATPLAQIHRGTLDGALVAVKLRRPGLEAMVRADLGLLDALRPPLAAAFPALDAGAILAQVREQALDELDFEHAAAQQRAVARALRRTAGVTTPGAHAELAAPEVLVAPWLDGPTLAERAPTDPGAVARALVAAHVDAARAGLVLIDSRPNHVVLLDDGTVGLLGTGAAVAGDRARLARQVELLGALRGDAPDAFVALAHEQLALLPERERAVAAHALLRDVLAELVDGEARLDAAALRATARRGIGRADEAVALLGRATPDPRDLWLGRGTVQLAALLAQLGASEDWLALSGWPHPER